WTHLFAAGDFFVDRPGLVHRLVGSHRDEGVEYGIELFDSRDGRGHQFGRLEFAPPDHRRQLVGRLEMEIGHERNPPQWLCRNDFYYGWGGKRNAPGAGAFRLTA